MRKSRFSEEQIIRILDEVQVAIAPAMRSHEDLLRAAVED